MSWGRTLALVPLLMGEGAPPLSLDRFPGELGRWAGKSLGWKCDGRQAAARLLQRETVGTSETL